MLTKSLFAVIRIADGREYIDISSLSGTAQDAAETAAHSDKMLPGWARENPVVRVSAVTLSENAGGEPARPAKPMKPNKKDPYKPSIPLKGLLDTTPYRKAMASMQAQIAACLDSGVSEPVTITDPMGGEIIVRRRAS